MMKQNKVQILLSTYNGEKYLEQLLDSLVNQEYVDISILIRDDGSTDDTLSIIESYIDSNKDVEIFLIKGKNIGYQKSFFELVKLAGDADYYAFCDQDDYWLSDKMYSAVKLLKLENNSIPLLYTSNVTTVDSDLQPLNKNLFKENRVLDIYESFQKSILPGCTFVFNNSAREAISRYDGYCESHDWAIYCICNTLGKVVFDNNPKILYRLHGNNTIGQSSSELNEFFVKFKRFFKKSKCSRSKFARDFYKTYEKEIESEEVKKFLYNLSNYKDFFESKISLLTSNKLKGTITKIYLVLNKV